MSFPLNGDEPDDDLRVPASEQRREIAAAKDLDSDLDFAFQLQLQEAINASLSLQPSTSSTNSVLLPSPQLDFTKAPHPNDSVSVNLPDIQSEELLKLEQEINDRKLSELEFKRMRDDLHRRIHDQRLAEEINDMPDDEWGEFGDNFQRPYGEGSSKGVTAGEIFRVYFKGLVEKVVEVTDDSGLIIIHRGGFGGIGVAVCDSRDELLFELTKPLYGDGLNRRVAEFMALIEGLNTALELDLKRVVFHCHYLPIYQFVTRRWNPKQQKIVTLVNQVTQLQGKFAYCHFALVPGNDVKFAFKLAKEAIVGQVKKPAASSGGTRLYETCAICLEDKITDQIFSVDGCMHRYCFDCMKQHVEVKMLYGTVPKCPHEDCHSELKIDSCSQFLTPKLLERMEQRMKEALIPVTEKLYCPYQKCSALMSKSEVLESSKSSVIGGVRSGAARCEKCDRLFCIFCKVPWHNNMSCSEFKNRHPNPPAEEMQLKHLAARNLWRQCIKCNNMIELAAGCYHMTCRCGFEFCYNCGAEWKNKNATCSCPLWDEDHIIDESDEDFDEENDDHDLYETDSDDYYGF